MLKAAITSAASDGQQLLAALAHRSNGKDFPSRYFKDIKYIVITFTLFMLASNLSCCTTFLMAVMLEDPDIALFLFGKAHSEQSVGGCRG